MAAEICDAAPIQIARLTKESVLIEHQEEIAEEIDDLLPGDVRGI